MERTQPPEGEPFTPLVGVIGELSREPIWSLYNIIKRQWIAILFAIH
jgi:hypothetical protein